MKSMNDKLQESREIKLNALIKDLQHWYVIGFNDEIINDDWRMFIFGSVQTVYNMGRIDAESRLSNDLLKIDKISAETQKKIEEYAAIYEIEF